MAEHASRISELLFKRAQRIVADAVLDRRSLRIPLPEPIYDFRGTNSFYVIPNGSIVFQGRFNSLTFAPETLISAVIAGDCLGAESELMIAFCGQSIKRSLLMMISDAEKIVCTCATMAEMPVSHLALAVKEVFNNPGGLILKNQPSVYGYPPVAPYLLRSLDRKLSL